VLAVEIEDESWLPVRPLGEVHAEAEGVEDGDVNIEHQVPLIIQPRNTDVLHLHAYLAGAVGVIYVRPSEEEGDARYLYFRLHIPHREADGAIVHQPLGQPAHGPKPQLQGAIGFEAEGLVDVGYLQGLVEPALPK